MRCPECKGEGFKEYEGGVIRLVCRVCHGAKEIPDPEPKKKRGRPRKHAKRA